MSEARTPNRPAAAAVSGGGGGQILHPIRRHLPFSSTRPPFIPSDDYHRFPSGNGGDVAGTTAYQNAEVIIVKSPSVKRKLGADYNKVPSNEWENMGYTDTVNSTLHTPVSAKGGRINARSKVTKSNKPAPQTPVSNTGSPSPLTPVGSCRYDRTELRHPAYRCGGCLRSPEHICSLGSGSNPVLGGALVIAGTCFFCIEQCW